MSFIDEIKNELIWLSVSMVVFVGAVAFMFPELTFDNTFCRGGMGCGSAPGGVGGFALIGIVATTWSIIYKWRNRL